MGSDSARDGGFRALIDIATALMSEHDITRLLTLIMDSVTRMLAAERSTLFIVDHNTQELWSRIAQGTGLTEIRLPLGKGIAGHVARTRERINIPDAYADPRFDQATDRRTGFRTRSILCFPLFDREDEVLGVIQVLNKQAGTFTAADEELLAALASLAAVAIENVQLAEERQRVFKSLVQTLAAAIDARDPATAGHSERVSYYSGRIGQALGLGADQLELLEYAALLHDVGKLGVRDAVLLKTDRLNDEEYAKMRSHSAFTREILANIHLSHDLRELPFFAGAHHERFDGQGYPDRLAGEKIPLLARIIAVADVFDALVAHDRPYKKAMPLEKALAILQEGKGKQFDPALVEVFVGQRLHELERRRCIRFNVELTMHYRVVEWTDFLERQQATKTGNISSGGLMFYESEAVPVGSYLFSTLTFPDGEFEALGQVMRVVWNPAREQYEIGVRLVNLPEHLARRLEALLEKNTGVALVAGGARAESSPG